MLYEVITATTKSGTSDKIRVTIIDYSGNVLGESETSSDSMENHIDRKEIQQALQEEIGSDTRFSKTIRVNLMYVARAVREKEIILRLAIPLTGLKAIYLKIFIYSFIAFMTAVALTRITSYNVCYTKLLRAKISRCYIAIARSILQLEDKR